MKRVNTAEWAGMCQYYKWGW